MASAGCNYSCGSLAAIGAGSGAGVATATSFGLRVTLRAAFCATVALAAAAFRVAGFAAGLAATAFLVAGRPTGRFAAGAAAFFAVDFAGAFAVAFLATAFFAGAFAAVLVGAAAFFAVVLAAAFFATGLAAAFFAAGFAAAFLATGFAAAFFAGAFLATAFFAGAFFVAARIAIGWARGVSMVVSSVLTCATPFLNLLSLSCALDEAVGRVMSESNRWFVSSADQSMHGRGRTNANRGVGPGSSAARRLQRSAFRRACPHDPVRHVSSCLIDSSAAFQGRGPLTVLLLNVPAHRSAQQKQRIDSRTQIPLFLVPAHMSTKSNRESDYLAKKFLCAAFRGRTKKQNRRGIAAAAASFGPEKAFQPRCSIGMNFRFSGPV